MGIYTRHDSCCALCDLLPVTLCVTFRSFCTMRRGKPHVTWPLTWPLLCTIWHDPRCARFDVLHVTWRFLCTTQHVKLYTTSPFLCNIQRVTRDTTLLEHNTTRETTHDITLGLQFAINLYMTCLCYVQYATWEAAAKIPPGFIRRFIAGELPNPDIFDFFDVWR